MNGTHTRAGDTYDTIISLSADFFFYNNIDGCCSEIYYIMHTTFAGSAGDQAICLAQNKVEKLRRRVDPL